MDISSPQKETERWQWQFAIKWIADRGLAMILLILLSPLMAILALMIAVQMGRPVLFCQPRPGRNGKVFTFYKFRSMTDERDQQGNLLPDTQRLTRLGEFLRQTSLDELPQLWNVLKGDMSFVGPRPLLVEFLDYYTPEQARRHQVLPGVTGWAQVNGRHTLLWADKCALDLWYVDHQSLGLDLKIMAMTVLKVLKREDIGVPGCPEASKLQMVKELPSN
jgi:lipopolysaccharide/colanic/teichoic acid biosynthesis glycosyltransferase